MTRSHFVGLIVLTLATFSNAEDVPARPPELDLIGTWDGHTESVRPPIRDWVKQGRFIT